jgi:tRNA(adenine34) deaminase
LLNLDQYFMQIALQAAEEAADAEEIPVGAVIVCNNQIVGRAHNLTERLQDVSAHAEILAIGAAAQALGSKYLPTCTLYVSLEPCPMCAGALAWAQIGRVVYAGKDEKRGFTAFEPCLLHPRTKITSGILETEATELLQKFFKKRR